MNQLTQLTNATFALVSLMAMSLYRIQKISTERYFSRCSFLSIVQPNNFFRGILQ